MAYYTPADLRPSAHGLTASAARAELSHSATPSGRYDIFLSHSISDEVLVLGLKNLLESTSLTVYVDWIEDPHLDRRRVTPATAARLRQRMNYCKALVFATSSNSPGSRWMPWELGYFDGHHGESKVAICPIDFGSGSIRGQEYLGTYKRIEPVHDDALVLPYVLKPSGTEGESLQSFVHGLNDFVGITVAD